MKTSVADRIRKRLKGFTEALERNENITERFTCRRVQLTLKPQLYSPEKVKKTRRILGASQAIFAILLGVSVKTVRAWEQGSIPSDMACRFMDEIRHNPKYWIDRLREVAVEK
jgi:putative transcriptional regulator